MRLNNENVKSEKSEKWTSEYHLFLPDGLNEEQMSWNFSDVFPGKISIMFQICQDSNV